MVALLSWSSIPEQPLTSSSAWCLVLRCRFESLLSSEPRFEFCSWEDSQETVLYLAAFWILLYKRAYELGKKQGPCQGFASVKAISVTSVGITYCTEVGSPPSKTAASTLLNSQSQTRGGVRILKLCPVLSSSPPSPADGSALTPNSHVQRDLSIPA